MLSRIKNWYMSTSNAFRAAVSTSFFVFVTTFSTALIGLLGEVQSWVNNGPTPDFDTFGKLVVSAAVTLLVGVVNYVVRLTQQKRDPEAGPQYGN